MKKIITALSGQSHDIPPFWFMRQAGRYMKEYRDLRAEAGSFLNLCMDPQKAAEVTMQPINTFDMDAAIIFADILLVPMALGVDLRFAEGEGPILGEYELSELNYNETKVSSVFEALKLMRQQLPQDKTLIGFAGSPWTVATYMIEKGSSKNYAKIKTEAISNPDEFQRLMDILVDSTTKYLSSQIDAGAEVIQIFDSWAGELAGNQFERWVIEPNARIVENLKAKYPDVKIIGFPRRSGFMLKEFCEKTKVDGISIDSSVPISWAADNLNCTIQGNLDQVILFADQAKIKTQAQEILDVMKGRPFIFNLGHGILPKTPVENVQFLCDVIRGKA